MSPEQLRMARAGLRLRLCELSALSGVPGIARALRCMSLIDAATLRAWMVDVGRRDALTRISHLSCELQPRLAAVDLALAGETGLPVTQANLGDTVDLSTATAARISLGRTAQPRVCDTPTRCGRPAVSPGPKRSMRAWSTAERSRTVDRSHKRRRLSGSLKPVNRRGILTPV